MTDVLHQIEQLRALVTKAETSLNTYDNIDAADRVTEIGRGLDALLAALAEQEARPFPIQDGPAIPWALIAPFERQAQHNHSQSLERLAERGGLAMVEALPILHAQDYHDYWVARLGRYPDRDTPPHAELLREMLELIATRQAAPVPQGELPEAVKQISTEQLPEDARAALYSNLGELYEPTIRDVEVHATSARDLLRLVDGRDALDQTRIEAAKLCLDRLLAALAAPEIECPACGEVVKQVASATLSLALWQHYNWVCKGLGMTPSADPNSVLLSVHRDEVGAVTAFLTQRAAGGAEGPDEVATCFRWAYRLLLALAKRRLADANAAVIDGGWPAGQQWHELVGSSHAVFLRQAREEAGIDHEAFLARIRSGRVCVDDLYEAAEAAPVPHGERAPEKE